MRVSGSILWGDLSKNLASRIQKSAAETPVVIVPEPDTKDDAKQSAIAYWTMGWNWDEIETVLEDSEYPKSAISYALTEAKNYAREILNSGPFATVRAGNLVCLQNGYVGEFTKADSEGMHMRIVGHTDVTAHAPSVEIIVAADDLDVEKSKELATAYELEQRAMKLIGGLTGTMFNKSAGLTSQTDESIIDVFINVLRVASSATLSALNKVSDIAKDTSVDNYVLTAARRDSARLVHVGSYIAQANKCILELRGADSIDGGTPDACVDIIDNSVASIINYVNATITSIPAEYAGDSPTVLNATSTSRYDRWDDTHSAKLSGAVTDLEDLLDKRAAANDVSQVDSLNFSNRRV